MCVPSAATGCAAAAAAAGPRERTASARPDDGSRDRACAGDVADAERSDAAGERLLLLLLQLARRRRRRRRRRLLQRLQEVVRPQEETCGNSNISVQVGTRS